MPDNAELEEFWKRQEERRRIQDTHSWVYKCFPPRPTTCFICGANKSDPNLKECRFGGTEA